MEKTLSQLRIGCTKKDQWLLVYFMTNLECNVCIADALFHSALAVVCLVDGQTMTTIFWRTFLEDLTNAFVPLIGTPHHQSCCTRKWNRQVADLRIDCASMGTNGQLFTHVVENQERYLIQIECMHSDRGCMETVISVEEGILWLHTSGWRTKQLCKPGMLLPFIKTCVEQTATLYRRELAVFPFIFVKNK
jgi:hypothetical protein